MGPLGKRASTGTQQQKSNKNSLKRPCNMRQQLSNLKHPYTVRAPPQSARGRLAALLRVRLACWPSRRLRKVIAFHSAGQRLVRADHGARSGTSQRTANAAQGATAHNAHRARDGHTHGGTGCGAGHHAAAHQG